MNPLAGLFLLFGVGVGAQGECGVRRVVAPGFPELAKLARVSGRNEALVEVAPSGEVVRVIKVSGVELFVEASRSAVGEWRFDQGSKAVRTCSAFFVYRTMPRGSPDRDIAARVDWPNVVEVRVRESEPNVLVDPPPVLK